MPVLYSDDQRKQMGAQLASRMEKYAADWMAERRLNPQSERVQRNAEKAAFVSLRNVAQVNQSVAKIILTGKPIIQGGRIRDELYERVQRNFLGKEQSDTPDAADGAAKEPPPGFNPDWKVLVDKADAWLERKKSDIRKDEVEKRKGNPAYRLKKPLEVEGAAIKALALHVGLGSTMFRDALNYGGNEYSYGKIDHRFKEWEATQAKIDALGPRKIISKKSDVPEVVDALREWIAKYKVTNEHMTIPNAVASIIKKTGLLRARVAAALMHEGNVKEYQALSDFLRYRVTFDSETVPPAEDIAAATQELDKWLEMRKLEASSGSRRHSANLDDDGTQSGSAGHRRRHGAGGDRGQRRQ